MRAIAGALLIVAASILFAAGVIVSGSQEAGVGPARDGANVLAAILGLSGGVLLTVGLATDRKQ